VVVKGEIVFDAALPLYFSRVRGNVLSSRSGCGAAW
jgi:hypothetical protein